MGDTSPHSAVENAGAHVQPQHSRKKKMQAYAIDSFLYQDGNNRETEGMSEVGYMQSVRPNLPMNQHGLVMLHGHPPISHPHILPANIGEKNNEKNVSLHVSTSGGPNYANSNQHCMRSVSLLPDPASPGMMDNMRGSTWRSDSNELANQNAQLMDNFNYRTVKLGNNRSYAGDMVIQCNSEEGSLDNGGSEDGTYDDKYYREGGNMRHFGTENDRKDESARRAIIHLEHDGSEGDDGSGDYDNATSEFGLCAPGTEQTGRWTNAEHDLFIKALGIYGKEWKRVAAMVGSRTVVQTRTHAQKYFQKLAKTSGGEMETLDMDTPEDRHSPIRFPARRPPTIDLSNVQVLPKKRRTGSSEHSAEDDPYRRVFAPSGGHISYDDRYGPRKAVRGGRNIGGPGGRRGSRGGRVGQEDWGRWRSLEDEKRVAWNSGPSLRMEFLRPGVYSEDTMQGSHDDDRSESYMHNTNNRGPYPTPSPAATGTRKKTELAVAELLAAAAATQSPSGDSSKIRGGEAQHRLRITNPDELGVKSLSDWRDPNTPWEAELMKLQQGKGKKESEAGSLSSEGNTPNHMEQMVPTYHGTRLNGTQEEDSKMMPAPPPQNNPTDKSYQLHQLIIRGRVEEVLQVLQQAKNDIALGKDTSERVIDGDDMDRKNDEIGGIRMKNGKSQYKLNLVNVVDRYGFSALMCAASLDVVTHGDVPLTICSALLKCGASVTATDHALNTAVHWAAFAGNAEVICLLAKYRAPLSAINQDGDTALHFSSKWARPAAIEKLLECGAIYNIRNRANRAAFEVAADALRLETNEQGQNARNAVREAFYCVEPRHRTLILQHKECLEHQPRKKSDWECPERISAIMERLNDPTLFHKYELDINDSFDRASVEALARVHSPEYINFVNNLSKRMESEGGPSSVPFTPMLQRDLLQKLIVKPGECCDTSFSLGSLRAARRAAGAVTAAVDSVLNGEHRNAFCAVRPPGHHAGPNGLLEEAVSCGFCIFNNVAVGAFHAIEAHGLERVAIVDTDVHHGNGTEEIVRAYQQPSKLLFYSSHLFDKDKDGGEYEFFPGSGAEDDIKYNIINVPVQPLWRTKGKNSSARSRSATGTGGQGSSAIGFGRAAFREAITSRLLPALRAFNPQLIILSSGFDAVEGDVGNAKHAKQAYQGANLTPEDYSWITERVQEVADMCCDGRVVSVLEGGYGRPPTQVLEDRRISRSNTTNSTGSNHSPDPSEEDQVVKGGYQYDAGADRTITLDRSGLADAVAAHVRALVDPYRNQNVKNSSFVEDDGESSLKDSCSKSTRSRSVSPVPPPRNVKGPSKSVSR